MRRSPVLWTGRIMSRGKGDAHALVPITGALRLARCPLSPAPARGRGRPARTAEPAARTKPLATGLASIAEAFCSLVQDFRVTRAACQCRCSCHPMRLAARLRGAATRCGQGGRRKSRTSARAARARRGLRYGRPVSHSTLLPRIDPDAPDGRPQAILSGRLGLRAKEDGPMERDTIMRLSSAAPSAWPRPARGIASLTGHACRFLH